MTSQSTFAASIEAARQEMMAARKEISVITRVSEESIEMMMVDRGLDWLELISNGNKAIMEAVPKMRAFWGLWKRIWLAADQEFLRFARDARHVQCGKLAEYYSYLHRVDFNNPILNNKSAQCGYHQLMRSCKTSQTNI